MKDRNQRNKPIRDFDTSISDEEIFDVKIKNHFLSWGIEDKIYKAIDGGFEIIKYNNYANKEKGEDTFTRLNTVSFGAWKGQVINGGPLILEIL